MKNRMPPLEFLHQGNQHLADDEVADFVNNSIPMNHRILVEKHLSVCDRCRKQIELVRTALRRYDNPAEIDQLITDIAEIRQASGRDRRRKGRSSVVTLVPSKLAGNQIQRLAAAMDQSAVKVEADAGPAKTFEVDGSVFRASAVEPSGITIEGSFLSKWTKLLIDEKEYLLKSTDHPNRRMCSDVRLSELILALRRKSARLKGVRFA